MPKKITFEHKLELHNLLKKDYMTDEQIVQHFKDKHRVLITQELIDKTKQLINTKQGRSR